MALKRFLALLVLVAFCGEPFLVLAQEVPETPEVPQAESAVIGDSAETPAIEEETPYDPSMPSEILATSTVAVEEITETVAAEEEVIEVPVLEEGTYVPGEVVVQYEDAEVPVIVSTGGEGVGETIAELATDPDIEFIEPNYVRSFDAIASNDTHRALLWSLENTGQVVNGASGIADADIDAPEAWASSTGTGVTVAIIDTGVDYGHPDLASNMWDGTACKSDTGGTLGGCVHGYDFKDDDIDPLPEDDPLVANTTDPWRHGTHVAGTVAAVKDNGAGIIGTAPGAKIMALRFNLDTASEVRAIDFARENGVKIINASYSGSGFSQSEYDAIKRFTDAGGIFVAAASNNGTDGDVTPAYPANYDLDGIISVAATTQSDDLASFSNYGDVSVDLGAPGTTILSTYPDNNYAYASGTSMATPHVAGAAAVLWSYESSLDASAVKSFLLGSGDAVSSLSGKTVSGKRLNAYQALRDADDAPTITLNGSNPMNLTVGETYSEPGATASDDVDGDLSSSIVISGTVDTAVVGTYVVTYSVSDLSGHNASIARNVVVAAAISSGGGGGGGGGGSKNKKKKSKGGGSSSKKSTPEVPQPRIPQGEVQGATTTTPTPVASSFMLGTTGPDVTAFQQNLARLGFYTGPITGYYGPQTEAAAQAMEARKAKIRELIQQLIEALAALKAAQ